MAMNIGEHYKHHQILGTPSAKDNLPFQLPSLTQTEIDDLDILEGPEGQSFLQDGMIIYNSTTEKVQLYANSAWSDL